MTNIEKEWNKVHPFLREWAEKNRTKSGDYSISKGGRQAFMKIHRTIKSQITPKFRDEVISTYMYKSVDDYYDKVRANRGSYKSYDGDWAFNRLFTNARRDLKVANRKAKVQ